MTDSSTTDTDLSMTGCEVCPQLTEALTQARVELRILQSAIQCGEDWTPTLDNSYRIMRTQIDAALSAARQAADPEQAQ